MGRPGRDWSALAALVGDGVFAAAAYVVAMIALLGPMAHSLAKL